jgi:zinc/manganese transport system substrate-binding protein
MGASNSIVLRMLLNLGLAALLSGGAVASRPAGDDDQPVIVVTMSIWADIVDRVDCGDAFDIQTLIPLGGDPHSYEPSMQDRDTLSDAALVVANGADLEAQLHDTLDTVADDGTTVFEVAEHVTTRPMGGEAHEDETDHADETEHTEETDHEEEGEDEHGHSHEGNDPHIWFDPTLVIEALPALGDALVEAGADRDEIDGCVETVTTELTELDSEIAATLDTVPEDRRLLVTNHDALGYFAAHYGFEILGSVLPSSSTLVQASPSELDDLADAIEAAGVPAIFAEALESTDDASALADRLGVEVVTLYTDSLGDGDSGVTSYAELLRFDAEAIATALAG